MEENNDKEVFVDLWKMKVPSKVQHFVWRLVQDRLPTRKNLRRRNVDLEDDRCLSCLTQQEDASHIFFQCPKVLPMWWECLSWVQIKSFFPADPAHHFLQHPDCHLPGLIQNRWHTLWASLTWCIWYQRNKLGFSGEAFDGQRVLEQALFFCWLWLKNFERNFNIPFHYWSSNIKTG